MLAGESTLNRRSSALGPSRALTIIKGCQFHYIMASKKAAGSAAKAEPLMPEDVSLLLQQGDLSTNLLTSATYQQLAITIAGLAIVFSLGGVVAASNLIQTILGGYLILWFLIQVPSAVFVLSQRYTVLRYRLVKKLIARQDYLSEKEKVVNFLEILVEKDSEREVNYKPVVFYFGALGVVACIISLVWELANSNIGMAGYSIGGIVMIATTFYWSGRLEREMNLTKSSTSVVSSASQTAKKYPSKKQMLNWLLVIIFSTTAVLYVAIQKIIIGDNSIASNALSTVFIAFLGWATVFSNSVRLKNSLFNLDFWGKLVFGGLLVLLLITYGYLFFIVRTTAGYEKADVLSNILLFSAALMIIFQEVGELVETGKLK